jgi:hypothetical protein
MASVHQNLLHQSIKIPHPNTGNLGFGRNFINSTTPMLLQPITTNYLCNTNSSRISDVSSIFHSPRTNRHPNIPRRPTPSQQTWKKPASTTLLTFGYHLDFVSQSPYHQHFHNGRTLLYDMQNCVIKNYFRKWLRTQPQISQLSQTEESTITTAILD